MKDVVALQQMNSIGLTAIQRSTIERTLRQLNNSDVAFTRRAETAAIPVRSALARVKIAMQAGKTPSRADLNAISRATAPLAPENAHYLQQRQSSIDSIRTQLSRAQLDAVRESVGMGPVGTASYTTLFSGPSVGMDWYAERPLTSPGSGISPEALAAVMDRARSLPALAWNNQEDELAAQAAAALGALPTSSDYATVSANMRALLGEVRSTDFADYSLNRDGVAMSLAEEAFNARLQQASAARNAFGAVVLTDDQAVASFFLRPEVLRSLQRG